ncbi:hypothetical protein [Sulfurospirillum diekertiae]|uniref:Uncharacterized protein n=1 Tax=Sulfurospirillum diekertiae TaxID=1854492 RepID=A0A1Y0HLQ1_9BACT|nr:hypothetical protein [Sulfurospirillum diekertiae]ARU48163.1 hypothetical protein Sdiek1_0997 [Sulfurospirillum diekertiae]ASC93006.1 hypothetical protein Sdiek2_0985 [Sulfurospirillum diekertiae]
MNQTSHYSQALIALLAMILLLMIPLYFSNKSFTLSMLVRVFGYGLVMLIFFVMLYEALMH